MAFGQGPGQARGDVFGPEADTDIEGEDLRTASVGPLTVVYWINRTRQRLHVIDIVWLG
ncbi:hypothetical protein [Streptomyces sp. NBC_01262]|uniref:hypothetical protein n=1 Tax=Streptomyces sp. NBC_01262 TaxID=2903803 RepID=UPI002E33AAE7|nr:hypothetical protein [Streptomyces sp. NBC_01262]